MKKYVLECEIKCLYGHSEPGDMSLSWSEIDKKTLRSKVLNFPNDIKEGEQLTLKVGRKTLTERVNCREHNFSKGHTVLYLGLKEAKSRDRQEAQKKFKELLRDYSIIKKL